MAIGYPKPKQTKDFETEAGKLKVKKLVENDIYTGRKKPAEMKAKDEHAIQHDYQHGPKYENDTVEWSRGGPAGGEDRPSFNHAPKRGSERRGGETKGGKCTASGADMESSPLSAARKTWGSPPTLNRKDWG